MESSFMWEYTMNWYTRATRGKSQSAYVKTVYTLGKTTLYGLWFVTDHTDDVGADGQALDQEVNVVVKHQFSDSLSAAVKAGYGHRDNRQGDNDEQEDYRLFITYDF
jgi:predicted porin